MTGELSTAGYVLFKDHQSAVRCVESGLGCWSESERVMGWQEQDACSYPLDLNNAIFGVNSQERLKCDKFPGIVKLRIESGLDRLTYHGDYGALRKRQVAKLSGGLITKTEYARCVGGISLEHESQHLKNQLQSEGQSGEEIEK